VILQRELAIRALDLLLRRSPGDSEHLVIIAFCVRRQRQSFTSRRQGTPALLVVFNRIYFLRATRTMAGRNS
jgi:hypothetical protein